MQWDDLKKNWATQSKSFKTRWAKLTETDLKEIAGKRDELVKRLQKHYPSEKTKLDHQVDDFVKGLTKTAKV